MGLQKSFPGPCGATNRNTRPSAGRLHGTTPEVDGKRALDVEGGDAEQQAGLPGDRRSVRGGRGRCPRPQGRPGSGRPGVTQRDVWRRARQASCQRRSSRELRRERCPACRPDVFGAAVGSERMRGRGYRTQARPPRRRVATGRRGRERCRGRVGARLPSVLGPPWGAAWIPARREACRNHGRERCPRAVGAGVPNILPRTGRSPEATPDRTMPGLARIAEPPRRAGTSQAPGAREA